MKREFLLNIIFLLGINLLIKPIYIFGIDMTVQNRVGPNTYGIYFVLFNFAFLFQILNDFGIPSFNNRNISQHRQLLSKYLPNILTLKLALALVYLLVLFVAAYGFGYFPDYAFLLFIIGINYILQSFAFYLRSNISGLGQYRVDSLISASDKLFMILICGFLLFGPLGNSFQISWLALSQTVALLLTIGICVWVLRAHLPSLLRFRFRPVYLLLIIKESYPYALTFFLMIIYTKIDSVMIEQLLEDGEYEAGVYASGYRLLDAANMVGFLFAGLLLPMFSRLLKERLPVASLVRTSILLIWSGAISLSVGIYFYQGEIVDLLYQESTPYWGEVLGYLMFTFIAVSGSYVFGSLLTANGSLMKMNAYYTLSIALNIALNCWLIPTHKAGGAAIATVATQFLALGTQLWLANRLLKLAPSWNSLWRLLVFAIGVVAAFYGMRNGLDWLWYWELLAGLGICLLLALLLRMIDWGMLLEWIRQKGESRA